MRHLCLASKIGLTTVFTFLCLFHCTKIVRADSDVTFLTFTQGDPGRPGDGISIQLDLDTELGFQVNPLFQLTGVSDGITITVFPNDLSELQSVQYIFDDGDPNCDGDPAIQFERPFTGFFDRGEILFNGVMGVFLNIDQDFLQDIVNLVNEFNQCDVTVDDLALQEMRLFKNPLTFELVTDLDAAAVGFGVNAVPLPDLADIFNNSVMVNLIGVDTISATFTPKLGLLLDQAAEIFGYDHFNWLNIVTKDNILNFPLLPTITGLQDQNGNLPTVPYFDPVPGGYQYEADECGTSLPVRDNLPWYLDEVFSELCTTVADPLFPGTILDLSTGPNSLGFQDIPDSPADIEFLTGLVGVKGNGTGDLLHFEGTVFRWKFEGGLNGLLFSPDLTLKNFEDFTEEEILLLESIPVIRDNMDPSLVSGTGSVTPLGLVETGLLTSGDLRILAANGIGIQNATGFMKPIEIDIKPGNNPNSINLKSKGVIPVAILTTEHFDASTVDPLSIEFGPNAAAESHLRGHFEDLDKDHDLDLILHFRTQETGIVKGDTEACLNGQTFDNIAIQGCDTVKTK